MTIFVLDRPGNTTFQRNMGISVSDLVKRQCLTIPSRWLAAAVGRYKMLCD